MQHSNNICFNVDINSKQATYASQKSN